MNEFEANLAAESAAEWAAEEAMEREMLEQGDCCLDNEPPDYPDGFDDGYGGE